MAEIETLPPEVSPPTAGRLLVYQAGGRSGMVELLGDEWLMAKRRRWYHSDCAGELHAEARRLAQAGQPTQLRVSR